MSIQTPVAYIVFNRPQHTEKTFAVLRKLQPAHLFIIADGPRSSHPTDAERCLAVRKIVDQVDWPCEVRRNYADSNLGLKRRISSGLDWVFEEVERAIILEDDCVAHPDFFTFCDDLLDRFADNEKIYVITGNNFQNGHWRGEASYYFSRYNHCWGWATWRRAWKNYEGDLPFWPEWHDSKDWQETVTDRRERRYWGRIFDHVCSNKIDSWAYPWTACVWKSGGLTATPNVNLVSNIGFGSDSTHTASLNSPFAAMATKALGQITHPSAVVRDAEADGHVFDQHFRRSWSHTLLRAVETSYRFLKRRVAWCVKQMRSSLGGMRD
ncbi:MAG: glycosyltransferase family 2 protein [Halieaceae bacterium]